MKLRAITAAGGICALGLAFGATPAFAAGKSNVVRAVTHTNHHPDTLNPNTLQTPATPTCVKGDVWSFDKLSFRFTVVQMTTGTYTGDYMVTSSAHGSFHAFANHTTGACTTFNGSVDGTLTYVVSSTTGPDPASLPSHEPGTTSQGDMIKQLFQTTVAYVSTAPGNGTYSYTYRLITGQKFVTAS